MRILSPNFVLLGRRSLRLAGLTGVAAACGSCAKFPANSNGNFTAITFSFTVASQNINTTAPFIYDVVINTSNNFNNPNLPPPNSTYAPLPVINSSNPNGRVAGSPNFLIEFNSLNPNSPLPFTLYRFALQSEVPNPSDPNNPVNLAVFNPATRGQISNFTTPQTGGGRGLLASRCIRMSLPTPMRRRSNFSSFR